MCAASYTYFDDPCIGQVAIHVSTLITLGRLIMYVKVAIALCLLTYGHFFLSFSPVFMHALFLIINANANLVQLTHRVLLWMLQ